MTMRHDYAARVPRRPTPTDPELKRALEHVRDGGILLIHSMDRLVRDLGDLRRIVGELTGKGSGLSSFQEGMAFTGENSAMNTLLLSMLGTVAEFGRPTALERQREGVTDSSIFGLVGREVG